MRTSLDWSSRMRYIYLISNTICSYVLSPLPPSPPPLMVPASVSPQRTEGEAESCRGCRTSTQKARSHSQAWNFSCRQSSREPRFTSEIHRLHTWGPGPSYLKHTHVGLTRGTVFGNIQLMHLFFLYTHTFRGIHVHTHTH